MTEEKCVTVLVGNHAGDHLGRPRLDGAIILKRILRK